MLDIVIIVGSPRSGTTILGNILGCHADIAEWYEPYYIWERYFSCKKDDIWQPRTVDERTRQKIRQDYETFRSKAGTRYVLDKSPGHSFNIEVIRQVFPEAKWIHILRDGRDVTLSIKKEWNKRKAIVKKWDFPALYAITKNMLKRQPFWRFRLKAILHELSSNASLNPLRYLNKARWEGKVGWGPRFEGWREFFENHTEIELNAMQWVKSIEAVKSQWGALPQENTLEIAYENMLSDRNATLDRVLGFLGLSGSEAFYGTIPALYESNYNKWKNELSAEEIRLMEPILTPLLKELGYLDTIPW